METQEAETKKKKKHLFTAIRTHQRGRSLGGTLQPPPGGGDGVVEWVLITMVTLMLSSSSSYTILDIRYWKLFPKLKKQR